MASPALRRLLAGVASTLRGVGQQQMAAPGPLAALAASAPPAAAAARGSAAASALAAARLFSSSGSGSLSSGGLRSGSLVSSSLAACSSMGLRQLACSSSSGGVLAAAAGCRPVAAGACLQQLRGRTTSSHLVPRFKGGKMKSYRCVGRVAGERVWEAVGSAWRRCAHSNAASPPLPSSPLTGSPQLLQVSFQGHRHWEGEANGPHMLD